MGCCNSILVLLVCDILNAHYSGVPAQTQLTAAVIELQRGAHLPGKQNGIHNHPSIMLAEAMFTRLRVYV